MGLFHILWSIVIGFVVGLVARALVPGADQMGLLMTTGLGIVGSLVGGIVGALFSKPREGSRFHPAGFLMSLVGAIVLLLAWRLIR